MPKSHNWFGLELLYPENWVVEEESQSNTISFSSPSGAFLSLTRPPDIQAAFERARITMEQEYGEMEVEPSSRLLEEALLEGLAQRFVYLDFIVTSYLYRLEMDSPDFLLILVQMQAEDRDMDRQQAVFDAILVSLIKPWTE
jgi:hypothetical protein